MCSEGEIVSLNILQETSIPMNNVVHESVSMFS